MLRDSNDDPRAFPPGELITSHEFYDYEAKYIDPDGATFAIPARLDPQQSPASRVWLLPPTRGGAVGHGPGRFFCGEGHRRHVAQ